MEVWPSWVVMGRKDQLIKIHTALMACSDPAEALAILVSLLQEDLELEGEGMQDSMVMGNIRPGIGKHTTLMMTTTREELVDQISLSIRHLPGWRSRRVLNRSNRECRGWRWRINIAKPPSSNSSRNPVVDWWNLRPHHRLGLHQLVSSNPLLAVGPPRN